MVTKTKRDAKLKDEMPKKALKSLASSDTPALCAEQRGNGLETQRTGDPVQTRTSQKVIASADRQNSRTAGPRGPTRLEGFPMRKTIFHFQHERINENAAVLFNAARIQKVNGGFVNRHKIENEKLDQRS